MQLLLFVLRILIILVQANYIFSSHPWVVWKLFLKVFEMSFSVLGKSKMEIDSIVTSSAPLPQAACLGEQLWQDIRGLLLKLLVCYYVNISCKTWPAVL